jgi:hypothetical protein
MNETFSSVLLFHSALKAFLLDTVGLTVDRTLGAYDVILTNGSGAFLRLQKKTNGATISVGMEVGSSADLLEISTRDPECWFPFDTTTPRVFNAEAHWFADNNSIEVIVLAGGCDEGWSKRYRARLEFAPPSSSLVHQDHLAPSTEPNFKERDGTYVHAGV